MVFYELCEVHVEGLDPIMMDGIKITDKTAVTKVTHGGSHEAIDYLFGQHDIDFTLTAPKDSTELYAAVNLCRTQKKRYTILIMGKPTETADPVPTHALYDCIFNEGSRDLEGKKETAATIAGSALTAEVLATEYS